MDLSPDSPEFSSENIRNFDGGPETAAGSDEVLVALFSQDGCPMGEALRNELILQQIFSHFKTKFLLSSVSLVCKDWNREARNFIHCYRKCAARKPPRIRKTSNCGFFRELNEICCQIGKSGRPIPWNLLELRFEKDSEHAECLKQAQKDYEDLLDKEVVDRMEVKHLKIFGSDEADCPVHKHVLTLIRHASSQLQSLEIHCLLLLETLLNDWEPRFPLLEEIEVFPAPETVKLLSEQKQTLTKLLSDAPKLRRFSYGGWQNLEVVPEEILGLIDFLSVIPDDSINEDDLVWRIAKKKPALKTFEIESPGDEVFPKFKNLLEQIFQGCDQSVQTITVYSISTLGQLSFLMLPNLTKLLIENPSGDCIDKFWKDMASFDFCKKMPKLDDMDITIHTENPEDTKIEWPKFIKDPDMLHPCTSIRKLKLTFRDFKINIPHLKVVFPNVTNLGFWSRSWNWDWFCDSDIVSFSEIWEEYPALEQLHIEGRTDTLMRNYDSQFCGISEEEAELLRDKDEEYLKAVHIVPIRPSVLTMPSLQKIWIHMELTDASTGDNLEGDGLSYVSKVSEFVAFKRMRHAEVRVCGVVGFNDISDLDDSDDEDG